MPASNGIAPDEEYADRDRRHFQGRYGNINLRLAYTGDILITEGYLYGDRRRNGLRFLRRHVGYGFRFQRNGAQEKVFDAPIVER